MYEFKFNIIAIHLKVLLLWQQAYFPFFTVSLNPPCPTPPPHPEQNPPHHFTVARETNEILFVDAP